MHFTTWRALSVSHYSMEEVIAGDGGSSAPDAAALRRLIYQSLLEDLAAGQGEGPGRSLVEELRSETAGAGMALPSMVKERMRAAREAARSPEAEGLTLGAMLGGVVARPLRFLFRRRKPNEEAGGGGQVGVQGGVQGGSRGGGGGAGGGGGGPGGGAKGMLWRSLPPRCPHRRRRRRRRLHFTAAAMPVVENSEAEEMEEAEGKAATTPCPLTLFPPSSSRT
jgi:hypothetical protein